MAAWSTACCIAVARESKHAAASAREQAAARCLHHCLTASLPLSSPAQPPGPACWTAPPPPPPAAAAGATTATAAAAAARPTSAACARPAGGGDGVLRVLSGSLTGWLLSGTCAQLLLAPACPYLSCSAVVTHFCCPCPPRSWPQRGQRGDAAKHRATGRQEAGRQVGISACACSLPGQSVQDHWTD